MAEATKLADGVYWVGATLEDDAFQCHAYLVVADDCTALIDPGSPLTIEQTLAKVESIVQLEAVKYLVCHHSDPDIAAALPILSDRLTRPDVAVVTEWRAEALLKHYGHRFGYYRVEDHDWVLPLGARRLEFQLTPYLHFPGALVSYDIDSGILFSADLFGGFVPDARVLESHDLAYIIDSARPFHQHYMPGHALLESGLRRVQQRWPRIAMIAPQHGHVIPEELVDGAFAALEALNCGVFSLTDSDFELTRLLRLSEAKERLASELLIVGDLPGVAAAIDAAVASVIGTGGCLLLIDEPQVGWRACHRRGFTDSPRPDPSKSGLVELPGTPSAFVQIPEGDPQASSGLRRLISDLADAIRVPIDQHLQHRAEEREAEELRLATVTDPLTGLGNRRGLSTAALNDGYALLEFDLDHFKSVNDTFGHAAGDHVLKSVADSVQSLVREHDRVYRIGGEEFLVLLPETGPEAAREVAERIRVSVAKLPLDGYSPGGRITVSIGIASHQAGSSESFDDVLGRADAALYEAKTSGRNAVRLSPATGVASAAERA